MSSGVTLQARPPGLIRPGGHLVRPIGWMGPPGFVPRRGGRVRYSRWALAGVLVALILAAGGATAATVAGPAAPPGPAIACAPAGAAGGLTAAQRANATLIIGVGEGMGVPKRAQLVSLVTAMQESSLINNPGGDRDSAGLFQQRPSQGWGTYAQVTDPQYATETFLKRLLALPGWERMPATVAAQTVQRSAYPDAYAKWEPAARALVAGTTCKKT